MPYAIDRKIRAAMAALALTLISVAASGQRAESERPASPDDTGRHLVVAVTANGRPIPGAVVDFDYGRRQLTDATGKTQLRVGDAGEGYRRGVSAVVSADGFATQVWSGAVGDDTTTRQIELVPETLLTGRVLDSSGRPVANAVLWAHPVGAWRGARVISGSLCNEPETIARSETDADGRFAMHSLGTKDQYLIVAGAPSEPSLAFFETTLVNDGSPRDIVLAAAGRLTTRIELAKPVSGPAHAALLRRQLEECTAPDMVQLEWLAPGTGRWQVVRGSRKASIAARGSRLRITFDQVPAGTVRLRTTFEAGSADNLSEPIVVRAGRSASASIELVPERKVP